MSEKRFAPTSARLAKARRDGDLAISSELNTVVAFTCAALALVASLPALADALAASFTEIAALRRVALPLGAVLIAGPLGAALAAWAQSGGLHLRALAFDPKRLAPHENLKRLVSRETLVALVRAGLATVAGVLVFIPIVRRVIDAGAAELTLAGASALARDGIERAWAAAIATGLALAIVDVAVTRRAWLHRLRMSFDEIRREHRENEGDPHARVRRKRFHARLSRNARVRVREASVLIVNPEHVAIGLRYAPPAVAVPLVVVRALDANALQCKAEARRLGILVVENAPLARSLYATTALDEPIPPEHYLAVAAIVATLPAESR